MKTDLKQALASVWTDRDVARLYRYRAPYPVVVFAILERLMVAPRVVLDAGAGTGAVARYIAALASRVDALDPSDAMIEEAQSLSGGRDRRIRWIRGTAEAAPLDPPYGLITCGQSLHWMDHDVVMPRFHDALAPGGRLAVLDHDEDYPSEWGDKLIAIIKRYSPIDHPGAGDLFGDLQRRGLFERHGYQRSTTIRFEQSVDEFVLGLESTSALSRVTLGARQNEFASEVRALFERLGIERVSFPVAGNILWGRPLRP